MANIGQDQGGKAAESRHRMTTTTQTITEFLLARIAEDEEQAEQVRLPVKDGSALGVVRTMVGGHDEPGSHDGPAVAIVASPSRVLAECEAKRRVIEAAWADQGQIEGEWGSGQSREEMDAKGDVPDAVVALATVYADHPDYREEWRG